MNAYEQGIIEKCAELGVNPELLIKSAQDNNLGALGTILSSLTGPAAPLTGTLRSTYRGAQEAGEGSRLPGAVVGGMTGGPASTLGTAGGGILGALPGIIATALGAKNVGPLATGIGAWGGAGIGGNVAGDRMGGAVGKAIGAGNEKKKAPAKKKEEPKKEEPEGEEKISSYEQGILLKCAELGLDKHANWSKIKDWLMGALKAKGVRSGVGKARALGDDVVNATGKYHDEWVDAMIAAEDAGKGFLGQNSAGRKALSANPEYAAALKDARMDLLKGLGSTGAVYGGLGTAGYGGLKALGGGKEGPADPSEMADAVKTLQRGRMNKEGSEGLSAGKEVAGEGLKQVAKKKGAKEGVKTLKKLKPKDLLGVLRGASDLLIR